MFCSTSYNPPRGSLGLNGGGVHGDEVRQELGRVVVLRARVALLREERERAVGGARIQRGPLAEQHQVVEHGEDAGARLVDGRHDGAPVPRQVPQRGHDLGACQVGYMGLAFRADERHECPFAARLVAAWP